MSALGTRKNPTRLRLAIIFVVCLVGTVLWNVFGPGAQAAQAKEPCTVTSYVAFVGYVTKPCTEDFDDIIGPDARQALGNTAMACGVGWAAGGPPGCGWGALGAALGSIPWDGTWDSGD